jgi:hypothetical protein
MDAAGSWSVTAQLLKLFWLFNDMGRGWPGTQKKILQKHVKNMLTLLKAFRSHVLKKHQE